MKVCVDASFVLKLVLPENSDKYVKVWEKWIEEDVEISSSYLLIFEVTSVIRNKVFRGILRDEEGEEALNIILSQNISLHHSDEITKRALKMANMFNFPNAYDCFYIATAESLNCKLWTADEKLFRKTRELGIVIFSS